WLDPGRAMLLEIDFPKEAAIGTHKGVDFVRDLTLVETIAPLLADQSQRSCQGRIFKNVAFCRRTPFAIEGVRFEKCAGQSFIQAWTKRPIVCNQIGDWKTFLGIANRGGDIVAQF